jgi:hypothetical protein
VTTKTCPVQKGENRNRKQEADEHQQSGEKPHLLLMRGQIRLSSANVCFGLHNFFIYTPDNGQSAIRCSPHEDFVPPTHSLTRPASAHRAGSVGRQSVLVAAGALKMAKTTQICCAAHPVTQL